MQTLFIRSLTATMLLSLVAVNPAIATENATTCAAYRLAAQSYLDHQSKVNEKQTERDTAWKMREALSDIIRQFEKLQKTDTDSAEFLANLKRQKESNRLERERLSAQFNVFNVQNTQLKQWLQTTQRAVEAVKVTCAGMPSGYPVFTGKFDWEKKPADDDVKQVSQAPTNNG